jgi:hypothetical protein
VVDNGTDVVVGQKRGRADDEVEEAAEGEEGLNKRLAMDEGGKEEEEETG